MQSHLPALFFVSIVSVHVCRGRCPYWTTLHGYKNSNSRGDFQTSGEIFAVSTQKNRQWKSARRGTENATENARAAGILTRILLEDAVNSFSKNSTVALGLSSVELRPLNRRKEAVGILLALTLGEFFVDIWNAFLPYKLNEQLSIAKLYFRFIWDGQEIS